MNTDHIGITDSPKVEPIWVIDPKTGSQVNVGPFLNTLRMFHFEFGPDSPVNAGTVDAVQRVIRIFSLIADTEEILTPKERCNFYYDLFRLWDMFSMTEIKPPFPALPAPAVP